MSLIEHAKTEFNIAGFYSESGDDLEDWVREAVLDLLETLTKHNPSGTTVGPIVNIFSKLAFYEPLNPITGVDEEWMSLAEAAGGLEIPGNTGRDLYQNKRCSHLFKEGKDGKAYDINGRVFVDQNGVTFTRPYYDPEHPEMSSSVYVDFPYTPKNEYVKVFYDYEDEDADFVILEDQ